MRIKHLLVTSPKNKNRRPGRSAVSVWVAKSVLPAVFVRYGELFAGVTTAGVQDAAAVGGSHAGAEAVLIHTLATGRLKCSFHDISFLYFSRNGLQR